MKKYKIGTLFPNTNETIAHYSPTAFCITLLTITERQLSQINHTKTDSIESRKILYHEMRHNIDHLSTLWGQQRIFNLFEAVNSRIKRDENTFHKIIKYKIEEKQFHFDKYFLEQHEKISYNSPTDIWIWTLSAGVRFSDLGSPYSSTVYNAHELAHVFVGHSAGFENSYLLPADDPTELLCDRIAAEFLVPETVLVIKWQQSQNISAIANHFKVSRIVIARRALDLGLITRKEFFIMYDNYTTEVIHKKENQGDGGDFYATQRKRLSAKFLGHVYEAIGNESLLFRDAYKLTGLKGETFHKSVNEILFKNA